MQGFGYKFSKMYVFYYLGTRTRSVTGKRCKGQEKGQKCPFEMSKTRKMNKNCIFLQKYLVNSKKSSTFARFFVGSVLTTPL